MPIGKNNSIVIFYSMSDRTKLQKTGKTYANNIVPDQTAPRSGNICLLCWELHRDIQ